MNLPVASDPVAVLVLAWDETTPATRVLVEATAVLAPALDSVVALIPTGLAADELSQEEFLPLEASITLPELPVLIEVLPTETPAEAASKDADNTEATADASEAAAPNLLPAAITSSADSSDEAVAAPAIEATAPLLPVATSAAATAAALVKPALVWQEVRVLHWGVNLGGHNPASLGAHLGQGEPTFVWTGAATAPAAPYLGSSESALTTQDNSIIDTPAGNSAVAAALLGAADTAATALRALRTLGPTSSGAFLATSEVPASTQPPTYPRAELPEAADAESDATPVPVTDESMPTGEASTTELSEEAATAEESFVVDTTVVQAAEPAAPAPPTQATPAPPIAEREFFAPAESPQLAALRSAGQAFDAPDLNFQIIRYARMAVPQALNERPFGVIYAPAWPTWLAAQELRHRSGQPLVLHIAKLAAADDEPIDLATGWIAELQRQGLHRADLILTETQALAQRLRHELALPAHRVRPVPATDAAAVAQALRTAVRV
jgi:hypothetical protein